MRQTSTAFPSRTTGSRRRRRRVGEGFQPSRPSRNRHGDAPEPRFQPPLAATASPRRSDRGAWLRRGSRGIPAFRILTDKALFALVEERPSNQDALLSVPGLGPKLVERYGAALLKIVAAAR